MHPIALSAVALDPASGMRRSSPRPAELRQPGYEEDFDGLTVFYDIFRSADGRWIVLIGPPLSNLLIPALLAVESAFGVPMSAFKIRNLDRNSQIWLPSDAANVVFERLVPRKQVAIQPNCSEAFRGKRAAFTVSKDNDLRWIRDWAYFHARWHGCNAVLFYDNNSSRYKIDEIHRALSGVPGLDTVVVVGWPYAFGPQGGASGLWDSDYCQYGVLEHARHRFLALAEACLNVDVDELVVTDDKSSVFDRVRKSRAGFIFYWGIWIESAATDAPESDRRHSQFLYRLSRPVDIPSAKWAVVPGRCPAEAQWRTHNIPGMIADAEFSRGVSFRHFRAINTNWKEPRWRPEWPTSEHVLDKELVEWMRVFGENDDGHS